MSPSDNPAPATSFRKRRRWLWSIQLVLLVLFGGLTIGTAIAVGLGFYVAAIRNAYELASDIGEAELRRIENALDAQLQPAAEQSAFLADVLAKGQIDVTNQRRVRDLLLGSLAAISQLEAVAFIAPDLTTIWATGKSEAGGLHSEVVNLSDVATVRQLLAEAEARGQPFWSAPIVAQTGPSAVMLAAVSPVMSDGKFIGAIAAGVSLPAASERMAQVLGDMGGRYFVMTADGNILFHSGLGLWPAPLPGQPPLPEHGSFSDPVLKAMEWPPPWHESEAYQADDEDGQWTFETLGVEEGEQAHLVVWRELRKYGQLPWVVGFHLSSTQIVEFAATLNRAIPFALVMLAVSLIVSLWLGRTIVRPIRALAAESRRIARLQFEAVPEPSTRIAEIANAAEAQAQMRNGLQWLSHYLPRRLLPALMNSDGTLNSREADVMVLFSDIIGFSRIAEGRSADRVASMLNRHFALLGICIDEESGTIDKYIGDSVMAFWGAPADQPDRSWRAQRAVVAIWHRLHEHNLRRAARRLPPIRIRIGLHRGPAVVGNIGAPGRINYTLIGDTVNVAQRLEQFGHEIDDGTSDVIVVSSAAALLDSPPDIKWRAIGEHVLPGRSTPTALFRMELA